MSCIIISSSSRLTTIPLMLLVTVLLTLSLVSLSFGLKCMVCNSEYDAQCEASPPPTKYLSECGEGSEEAILNWHTGPKGDAGINHKPSSTPPIFTNFTLCRKIQIKIPLQVNGVVSKEEKGRTVRFCGHIASPREGDEKSCRWVSADYVQTQICTCTEDGCNPGGPGPTSSLILLLIPVIIATTVQLFI